MARAHEVSDVTGFQGSYAHAGALASILDLSCLKFARPSIPHTMHGSSPLTWAFLPLPAPASSGARNQHFKHLPLLIMTHNWFVWGPRLPGGSVDEIEVSCLGPKEPGVESYYYYSNSPKSMLNQAKSVHI